MVFISSILISSIMVVSVIWLYYIHNFRHIDFVMLHLQHCSWFLKIKFPKFINFIFCENISLYFSFLHFRRPFYACYIIPFILNRYMFFDKGFNVSVLLSPENVRSFLHIICQTCPKNKHDQQVSTNRVGVSGGILGSRAPWKFF